MTNQKPFIHGDPLNPQISDQLSRFCQKPSRLEFRKREGRED